MTTATSILKDEHRVIERFLGVLDAASERLQRGERVPPDLFVGGLTFIRIYVDATHHGKEEGFLFPAIERHATASISGPIGALLIGHNRGRNLATALGAAAGDYARGVASVQVVVAIRQMDELYAELIPREEDGVFAIADKLLGEAEQDELARQFAEVDHRAVGHGRRERFLALLDELSRL